VLYILLYTTRRIYRCTSTEIVVPTHINTYIYIYIRVVGPRVRSTYVKPPFAYGTINLRRPDKNVASSFGSTMSLRGRPDVRWPDGRTGGQQMAPEIDDGELVSRAPLVNWSIGAPPPLARLTAAALLLLLILYRFRRNGAPRVYDDGGVSRARALPPAPPRQPARPTDRRCANAALYIYICVCVCII